MEQKTLRKTLWEEAGKAGLVLGLVSSTYLFLTQFLGGSQMPELIKTVAGVLLWAGKFGGCIYLMAQYMKRFAKLDDTIETSSVFRFGLATSLLSALVFAAASFANTAFISSDMINEQVRLLMEQMGPMMDSNSLNQIEDVMAKLPQITFFSNLFYCIIYGGVLSFIISRTIADNDPFANYKSDDE